MSKPKGPVLTQAEELREATRAAHEAARDLRAALAAARDLREESFRLQRDHVAALGVTLAKARAAADEQIASMGNEIMDHLQEQATAVVIHLDQLLGATDPGGLAEVIIQEASRSLAKQLSAELDLPPGARIVMRPK